MISLLSSKNLPFLRSNSTRTHPIIIGSHAPGRFFRSSPLTNNNNINTTTTNWKVVIGLEVHAQITSKTKLFSRAQTEQETTIPNSHVAYLDAALPGTLPVCRSFFD